MTIPLVFFALINNYVNVYILFLQTMHFAAIKPNQIIWEVLESFNLLFYMLLFFLDGHFFGILSG